MFQTLFSLTAFGQPECSFKSCVGRRGCLSHRVVLLMVTPCHLLLLRPPSPFPHALPRAGGRTSDVLKVDGWWSADCAQCSKDGRGWWWWRWGGAKGARGPRLSPSALSSLHSPLDGGQVRAFSVMIRRCRVADSERFPAIFLPSSAGLSGKDGALGSWVSGRALPAAAW